jgi:hypothetical protein
VRTWTSSALRNQKVAVSHDWMKNAMKLQKMLLLPHTASAPCEPRCAPPRVITKLMR